MISKCCFKCNVDKPLFDFYKHPRMPDGHVNKCKECNKKDVRENRDDKLEKYREYDKSRNKTSDRLEIGSKAKNNYILKNPIKRQAVNAVNSAIKSGLLVKPTKCSRCDSQDNIQGHHWSYLKENWLNVIWLCSGCHGREHSYLRRNNINLEV